MPGVTNEADGDGERERSSLLALLAGSGEAVGTVDRDQVVTFANPAFDQLLRGDGAGVEGRDLRTLLRDPAPKISAAVEQALSLGGEAHALEYVPGLAGWIELRATEHGEGAALFMRDVTEQQHRELSNDLWMAAVAAVDSAQTPMAALKTIMRVIRDVTHIEVAELWLVPQDGSKPTLAGCANDPGAELTAFCAAADDEDLPDDSAVVRAHQHGVPTAMSEPASVNRAELAQAAGLRASLHLPLRIDGSNDAVISLFTTGDGARADWLQVAARSHRNLVQLANRHTKAVELSRAFYLSREPACIVDVDGRFRRVNRVFASLLGYPEEDLRGRRVTDYLHPDDVGSTEGGLLQHAQGVGLDHFVNRYRSYDGSYRTLSWASEPLPLEGLVYAAGRDITEDRRRQRFESAQLDVVRGLIAGDPLELTLEGLARTIEERFPALQVLIRRLDPDSGSLQAVAAWSLPDWFLRDVREVVVGDEGGACGVAAGGNTECSVTDIATDPLGAPVREAASELGIDAMWSVPCVGRRGQVLGTFAVFHAQRLDPTAEQINTVGSQASLAAIAIEHHRGEAMLLASEERFRLLADATSDAIFDWDVGTGEVWWNDGVERLLGYSHNEVERTGEAWLSRIHASDRGRFAAEVTGALRGTAKAVTTQCRFVRVDGEVVSAAARASIIRDSTGAPVRVVGGLIDETERREHERRYLRTQRVETIGNLAGGIAHDLNNLLAPILLAAELLDRDEHLDEQTRRVIGTVKLSAQRGSELVRQVLSFARGGEPEVEPVEVGPVLREFERIVQDSFPKGIEILLEIDPDLPRVIGDTTQIQQVLLNLAVNARDAMLHGGTVRIEATTPLLDREAAATEGDLEPGPYLLITVSDTGSGIPEDVLPYIFEPFFTTKGPADGTGLGLSTSRSIARAHGGELSVTSEPEVGTSFRLYLPATPELPRIVEASQARDRFAGDGEVILVIDDEASVRAITEQTLVAFGYRVITASDGAAGVAAARRVADPVDLVLVDLVMPGMDGVETMRTLREIDPDAALVVTSGLEDHDTLKQEARRVADLVIHKPFAADQLLEAIRDQLRLVAARRA